MPTTRRRKFSVKNDLLNSPPEQKKTTRTGSTKNLDVKRRKSHSIHGLNLKSCESVTVPIASTAIPEEDDDEGLSPYSFITKVTMTKTIDQEVMASSSVIDLLDILSVSSEGSSRAKSIQGEASPSHRAISRSPTHRLVDRSPKRRQASQDKPVAMASRRDKTHQHCVTVRSPKRGALPSKVSVALSAIDLSDAAIQGSRESVCSIGTRVSSESTDDMCRICHGGEQLSLELGALVSACACRGTVGRVHVRCLERWLTESGKSRCELCRTKYATRRVHKYGFPKALFMWMLSQNAKQATPRKLQLLVDSLGIMLMSPLAVLAAWLSGRTLAVLMTQEPQITPWPLASTFVLACMTLVCYYCWVVSAATRHALGWWLWYRAQYELRLELTGASGPVGPVGPVGLSALAGEPASEPADEGVSLIATT